MTSSPRSAALLFAVLLTASAAIVPAAAAVPVSSGPVQVAVIPADQPQSLVPERIQFAGTNGALGVLAGGFAWTTYATGQTNLVTDLPFYPDRTYVAGPDTAGLVSGQTAGTMDFTTRESTSWSIPSKYSILSVHGNHVLVRPTAQQGAAILTFSGTTPVTTDVTGLPAESFVGPDMAGDQTAAVVGYTAPSARGFALIDLATGAATILAGAGTGYADNAVLTPTQVAIYDRQLQIVHLYSRADLSAGPADTSLPATTAPDGYSIGVTGGAVIAALAQEPYSPAIAVPVGGGPVTTVLPHVVYGQLSESPDGTVIAMGGTDQASYTYQRLTADPSGDVTVSPVPSLAPVTPMDAGLTIAQGVVRHIEGGADAGGDPESQLFDHLLEPATAYDSGNLAPPLWYGPLFGAVPCSPDASCVRSVDDGYFGTDYLMKSDTGQLLAVRFFDTISSSPLDGISIPSADGSVVDASPGGEIVDGSDPARQYIITSKIVSTGPVTGAGLWYSTLWRSDGAGRLRATDIDTMATRGTVQTGSACVASDVQATLRWVYWSCGTSGPAGVYDLKTNSDITVPSGRALLGDGYLVIAQPAQPGTVDLVEYDFHAGTVAAPVTIANVPAGPGPDSRNITWSVDKYGGDIAYADAADAVHVIDPGVPRTWPAAYDPSGMAPFPQGQVDFTSSQPRWEVSASLYSPVSSWQLQIRRHRFGPVVYSASGGPVARSLAVTWNGLLADGQRAVSGVYDWTLRVVPPDGGSLVTADHGTLSVYCGQVPFRASDCSGAPSLLGIRFRAGHGGFTAQWRAHWITESQPGRRLVARTWFADIPFCAAPSCVSSLIPFGDAGRDRIPDLLVRYRNGNLGLERGPTYSRTSIVGRDFNRYTLLAAPGDLTGDGIADLVATDRSGRLWLYPGTGHDQFRARQQIGSGFGQFARLIGAGDLTGSGSGDLLAIDRHGVMWRYDGNGHGGLDHRVRISAGWSRYNAVIGIGDLNYDGTSDLVARDPRGNLWFFAGDGHGTFARPVLLSGGWQLYKYLF